VSSFIDLYLDAQIPGWPCYSSPRFSTTITATSGGAEKRNRNWAHPLHTFRLPEAIREQETYEALHDHWLIVGGRESTFPFRDPLDFATVPLAFPNVIPDFTATDQILGSGDGLTRVFQLSKEYTRGGFTYQRPIYLPVLDSLALLVNGFTPAHWGYTYEISRPGGEVTFTPALAIGHTATWGGLFDVEVRFERDDSLDGIVQNFQVAGFADLTLSETRRC
jgi:uncharacterized protein (TIGR02217 family)